MIIVLTVVSTITFFVSRLLLGDPISLWVGDHPTKEQLETAKKDLLRIIQKKMTLQKDLEAQYRPAFNHIYKVFKF